MICRLNAGRCWRACALHELLPGAADAFSDSMHRTIFLVAGIALGWYSYELPSIPGQNYGASTFPFMIALGMIGCSARLIYVGWRSGEAACLSFRELAKPARAQLDDPLDCLHSVFEASASFQQRS